MQTILDQTTTKYKGEYCKRGVAIAKSSLNNQQLETIRKDLFVTPFVAPGTMQKPASFSVYRESSSKIYVPRFYAIHTLGITQPDRVYLDNVLNEQKKSISENHFTFSGSLRDYQNNIVDTFIKESQKTGCGLLEIPCGRGKCLGRNTPVMMYDKTIKFVQDIIEGDLIRGDDEHPRTVSGLARGVSTMYKVKQSNKMTYRVNDAHILTIYDTSVKQIIDILVENVYKDLLKPIRNCQIYGVHYDTETNAYSYHTITIEKEDDLDYYYGFELDGNHRFLLKDGTVTHNTVMGLNIISLLKVRTLVIVHKEFLMNQWIERIQQFLPNVTIGKIQGKTLETDKDIVIGMLQSLSMKNYEPEVFSNFGLTIVDECHHIASEVFSRSLFKIMTPYMLGLSATMERKDRMTHVFKMFLGDIIYKEERDKTDEVRVRAVYYNDHSDDEFSKTEYNFRGQTQYSAMIKKLCEHTYRSELILRVLEDLLREEPSQQIMILAHNKSILAYLHDTIEERNIAYGSVGYYVGGMKETQLKETETKKVVIATYAMAEEALDIKTLSCLILATPKTDVTQAVGRILRMKHKLPVVVDIVDQHDIFKRQWDKRRRFYTKCNYSIQEISNTEYHSDFKTWHTIYSPQTGKKRSKYTKQERVKLTGQCMLKI
jgi:superfamily II DNA or RNA helicase